MRCFHGLPPTALLPMLLIGVSLPAPARAQVHTPQEEVYTSQAISRYDAPSALPGWRGEVSLAAANALLSGLSAGLAREFGGGSFRQGFLAGAAGGVVAYSGRRVSILDAKGAGFLGRELNAVGASMVRNASAGQGAFATLVLPLGPTRIYIDRNAGPTRVYLKVSAYEAYWTARAALDPELAFRGAASLSAGAPVFQKKNGRLDVAGAEVNGYQLGGVIFLSREAGLGQHWTLPHETVHVLQSDFMAIAWLDPVEGWAMQQSGATRSLHRVLDPGLMDTAVRTALTRGLRLQWINTALEFEAELLESRGR